MSKSMLTKSWSVADAELRTKLVFDKLNSHSADLKYVFTETFYELATDTAAQLEKESSSPLAGALVSVKDLFDVKNYVTRAGSKVLSDNEAASHDAEVIIRLKEHGVIIIGKTNMTELAYSGLGVNPHYGTPENPILKGGRIPGGSTSGGAVSVAVGAADIAIGTDTGGSLRIPAAFCGLVGFKPTQSSVPQQGCLALSTNLDSIGPIAQSVHACELAWRAMAKVTEVTASDLSAEIVIPTNFGFTDLDDEVASGFNSFVTMLREKGYRVTERKLDVLSDYVNLPVWHFSAVESRAIYEDYYKHSGDDFDPRVYSRMARADELSAIDYCQSIMARQKIITDFTEELGQAILLLPTVAIMPPTLSSLDDDKTYNRLNLLALRNTSLANVTDACSISLPFNHKKNVVGAMFTAINGQDLQLLSIAKRVEKDIAKSQLKL